MHTSNNTTPTHKPTKYRSGLDRHPIRPRPRNTAALELAIIGIVVAILIALFANA